MARPSRSRRNGSAVGAETYQIRVAAEFLATQVADIVLPARGHFSRGQIADMGIMRPHDRFAAVAVKRQQILQRREHVLVAQVPGCARTVIHNPIITLRVRNEARILYGVKEALAVARGIGDTLFQQIPECVHHLLLAIVIRDRSARRDRSRRIALPWRQATIALTRHFGVLRIDLIEISQNRVRSRHPGCRVEAVKCRPRFSRQRAHCAHAAS